jgi:hypothetical protein
MKRGVKTGNSKEKRRKEKYIGKMVNSKNGRK